MEESTPISLIPVSKLSYILPVAKIILGTSQLCYEFINHVNYIECKNYNYLAFFSEIKNDLFGKNPLIGFFALGRHIAPTVSGNFLIKSGIEDLKELKKQSNNKVSRHE